ncbi:helix-turn-helix domain-containing protein [Planobispora longispora]|uniref:Winged helix-turn helix domain-containing protein n=1 Tax=Planobispora longispora TaxID=28887 RepID=A0A8J3RLH7_9ACTN|nr:winged helix-turn-helix domain-containing protein [Planobispora longispora]GIH77114.1 hypothetical protein Plo01_35430 [Planobispora longispora]
MLRARREHHAHRARVTGHRAFGTAPARLLQQGGEQALRSAGPVSREWLSAQSWAKREAELKRGTLAHGVADDQHWTLSRIKTVIGRMFHLGYTVQGVAKLLRRHGWSAQIPLRRAVERDEEVIGVWQEKERPRAKPSRRT